MASTMGFMVLIVYTKRGCWWCDDLLSFLRAKSIPFEEREVLSNPTYFKEMVELSGQTKAPTVLIDDKVYADTDKEEIESILKAYL